MDSETFAHLRLARSRGVGPVTHASLLRRFGGAAFAIEALPEFLRSRRATGRISLASEASVEAEWTALERKRGRFVLRGSEDYPIALEAIADPPPVLSVLGKASLLSDPAVAIVGARNASAVGRRMTQMLSRNLGEAGLRIVSGLARGIDGAAHGAALESGTVAALAGGVDQIYPPEHDNLYSAIAEKGAVVSEMPLGFVARARDFPKRNRIVSGLCRAVVVVEAAERSGTLITARLALEQGREVCAVPGSPLDPRCAGTNRLIKQGAALIRDADDVLDLLEGMAEPNLPPGDLLNFPGLNEYTAPPTDRDRLRQDILLLLGPAPVHRDILIRESTAGAAVVADVLLDLVLDGTAQEMSGGYYVLAPHTDEETGG